jgi:hypothetical protein
MWVNEFVLNSREQEDEDSSTHNRERPTRDLFHQ